MRSGKQPAGEEKTTTGYEGTKERKKYGPRLSISLPVRKARLLSEATKKIGGQSNAPSSSRILIHDRYISTLTRWLGKGRTLLNSVL